MLNEFIKTFALRFTWIWILIYITPIAQGQRGHIYNESYTSNNLNRVAFPMGSMGAGMICLEGTGTISHVSIRHSPDLFNEPMLFAALSIRQIPKSARVLEGPVPGWKKFGQPGAARGAEGTNFGLARFKNVSFMARFPFGKISLSDPSLPVKVTITGWSPFIPTDANNSSLPVGGLEYHFKNTSRQSLDYVFSCNSRNFLGGAGQSIDTMTGGYILHQYHDPQEQSAFAIFTQEPNATIDYCWFRGGWWDPLSMAWNKIENNDVSPVEPVDKDAHGASLYVPFTLKPGEEKTIRVLMAWYVPSSNLRYGVPITKTSDSTVPDASKNFPSPYYKPWYSSRFQSIYEIAEYWKNNYVTLRHSTKVFTEAFYKSSLPPEVTEAVAANLTILKSPTVMRQYDGRFWGWEGCNDSQGSCTGTCTHVWNYAQALPHLFPDMERSIRETEFNEDMDTFGHQNYRAALPIRPAGHDYYFAAADGQLGGVMKVYRDWRISGDDDWLKKLFPKIKISLDYCIRTWDPSNKGILEEPHHNTYDIEFWGPEPMCSSIYIGALKAMIEMCNYLKINEPIYNELFQKGKIYLETKLFNGDYFFQDVQWTGLKAPSPVEFAKNAGDGGEEYSPEAVALLKKEGPKYQYGNGCLSDGVIGCWMAKVCGLDEPLDPAKVKAHLSSVYQYNYKKDLSGYSNPQRSTFALGKEGGLLLCSWPKGGQLSLPFVYSNEVWTGVEYEVASHLILEGKVKEGLDIVRTVRNRYDGTVRNPFDEYECGHWYARAMSSYALIEALTGVRYDAVEKTLYVDSKVGDFTSFLSTATGFGNVIYKNGKISVNVTYGHIEVKSIKVKKLDY